MYRDILDINVKKIYVYLYI